MNGIDAEFESVTSGNMSNVVTQLIFVLIAKVGKESDGGCELVVAESLESGDG